MELAEAGVELALYSESNGDWSNWTIAAGTASTNTMTMTSHGLVLSSTSPTALILGNGVTGTVSVTIANYTTNPVITSSATVSIPSGKSVSRKIVTTAGTSPLFVNAIAATSGKVKFSSTGGSVDSYDSRIGSYSAPSRGYQAVVLFGGHVVITHGRHERRATLYGYAVGYDGPAPTTTGWFSTSGKVLGPSSPGGGTPPDATRIISDPSPYQPIFSIPSVPTDYNGTIPPGTYNVTTPATYVLSKGSLGVLGSTTPFYYLASGINITSNTVSVLSPVVIILYGSMNISGTGGIQLTTANSALTIFVENSSATIGGNGITFPVSVANPLPKRVSILSTNNNSIFNSITISTSIAFYGTVYFPYLPITISGSPQFYGSVVGESVTVSGLPSVHYDLALRYPDTLPGDFAFTLFPGFALTSSAYSTWKADGIGWSISGLTARTPIDR